MPKLTKRVADAARPEARERVLWDSEVPRFGLRVRTSGVKTFIVQYRAGGRVRKLTLGQYGPMTVEEARKSAKRKLGKVADGADPAEERDAGRDAPTVEDLMALYLERHAPKKQPRSVAEDRRLFEHHLAPAFGRRLVSSVTRGDMDTLHAKLREAPFQANRVLSLASKLFNLAEHWGYRAPGTNPCRGVERYREERRARFLSEAELARLGAALADAEGRGTELPSAIAAVRLLLLTGARRGEVLDLQWEHVDFERRCLRLPASKTGAKIVTLNTPALEVLNTLKEAGVRSRYVIPGRRDDAPLVGLPRAWQRLQKAAGLEGVRLHDLRHSFAATAAGGGTSLHVIGALLGHSQAATTKRYAHLSDDPRQQAAEAAGSRLAAALDGKSAPVVPIRPGVQR